jgi:hypothetical protein
MEVALPEWRLRQRRAQRSSGQMSSGAMVIAVYSFGCLAFVLVIFYLLGWLYGAKAIVRI